MLEKTVSFEVHESHLPLWTETHWRYAFIMGGRGNGRSGTASRYAISQLLSKEYTRGAIMRAVHGDIRASCWGEIIDRINEQEIASQFHIVENDMVIKCGENSLRAHGFKASSGSLTARLKSLAGYNFIWIEEAEEIGEDEFRKLNDSLRTVKGRIRIVFSFNTPPKSHWLIKQFFDLDEVLEAKGFYIPRLKEERKKDSIYIGGTWRENAPNIDKNTAERYEEYRLINPSYYWQVIRGYSPDEVRGKIFNGWQLVDSVPDGARLIKFGVDWGWYPDPMVAVAIYYYNGSYIVDELTYSTHIEDESLANSIKEVVGWEYVTAICGADEPKSIELLRKYGVKAEKTDNRPGSVEFRIKVTSTKKIFVTKRSTKIWESYENYRWAEDKDGNPKGEPDHFMSDGMDAVTYPIASINPLQNLIIPRKNIPIKRYNKAV